MTRARLTFTTLWAHLEDDKFMTFFLFFTKKQILNFLQMGLDLQEM